MKKILTRIICVFCAVSLVLMALITLTIAESRIARDKDYIYSTLLDLENTIEKMIHLNKTEESLNERQEETIQEVFEVFSSAQYTIYAVVMKDDGETIALSKNNVQEFAVNGGLEGQAYLRLLQRIAEGKENFVTINHSIRLAQAVEEEDYFIVAYKDNSDLVKTLLSEALIILVFIVICSGIIVMQYYRLMKRYVFDDLESINHSIANLLNGDYATDFRNPQIEELLPLVDSMEKFKKVFLHKADRMDRILNVISPDIGIFECFNNTCLNFYSHSLWAILEMSESKALAFQNSSTDFRKMIGMMLEKKSERDIVDYKRKHLEVHAYDIDGDYIGVVIDRTREENQTLNLINTLEKEIEKGMSDTLTGIRNREGFRQEVEQLILKNKGGVLLICDLDNFKRVNDAMGHPEGDKVLILFADCIRGQFRKSDILGRLGGDEFVVFLPNEIKKDLLKSKLDAMMLNVNKTLCAYKEYELGVSIGAGVINVERGISDFKRLYESADSALYVAKQMGKNQYYINWEGIRCMNQTCVFCRESCPKREALERAGRISVKQDKRTETEKSD